MAKAAATPAATLEGCLAEARTGKLAPIYLFDGDAFLADRAATQLAEAIVPESERSLSLVELDPAATPADVAAELATGALFGGRKVVIAHAPAFLTSKEDSGIAFDRARQMWRDGRQREAVRRVLALAAKASWAARDLDPANEGAPDADAWKEELGIELQPGDAGWMRDASRYALERDIKAGKEDAAALESLIERGLPPGHVLVIAADMVDARLPISKKLITAGRRVPVGVVREWNRGEERIDLAPILADLLANTGRTIDRAAAARLTELLGDDVRTLASEVKKLIALAGDRKTITRQDVDEIVTRVASDPFFALGNAVEARDVPQALGVLDRSMADGASAFLLLGSVAATVRRLLVERERAAKAAPERKLRNFDDWSDVVLPTIPAEEIGTKKPYGIWMKYQASQRFSRSELLGAMVDLAAADFALKSGQASMGGRVALERAIWRLCGGAAP